MASKIKGITIEIGGNTTKLEEALKDVNKVVYSTNSELKSLNQALKLDPKNTELLAQKQELLGKNIKATTEKLNTLKEAQKQMGNYSKLTEEQKEQYRALSAEIAKSENALKKLSDEYKNFGSVAKQQLKQVGDEMIKTGDKISSIGKKALPATAGIVAIGTASAKAAGELEQSLGGAEAVFKDFSDEIINSAKTSSKVMGTSTNDYLEYANKIGSLMQGSGLDIETTYDLTTKAMQRASDVASIMGIDISSAMEAITGAAKGNFTMMDNLGVAMNATTLQSYALSKGIDKSYSEMTNAEKVQLAYSMFLEQTSEYAGNYAKENDTLNGSITTMTANLKNLSASIGEKLLPIAEKVVGFISDIINKFSNLDEKTQNMILLIGGIIAVLGPTLIIIGKVTSAVGVITKVIGTLIPVISTVVTALGWPVIAITAVIGAIVLLWNKCEWFRDGVKSVINAIIEFFKSIPEKIKGIFEKAKAILTGFIEGFKNIGGQIIQGLIDGILNIGNKIKDTVKNIGKKITDGFKSFFGIHSPSRLMSDEVGSFIGEGVTEGIIDGIEETENKVNNAMKGLASGIETSVNPTINPTANTNPLIIQIENFNNNSESDIQELAQKLEFYRRNSALAKGGNQ